MRIQNIYGIFRDIALESVVYFGARRLYKGK